MGIAGGIVRPMDTLRLKRVYDPPEPGDGRRVLVDRLWPRGLNKARASLDEWAKEVAPSSELRVWFHAGEGDWGEFRRRYLRELADNKRATDGLAARLASGETVTLLFASREPEHNHARVLAEYLRRRVQGGRRG